ncbi:MAG TPA: FAD-dependent oxidoreductase [Anaerolineae bacterium]|nr:FAD-dependent oxidoreductase [Anaerolineae bacterium]
MRGERIERQHFVILGGGIAGLTAACELLRRGQQVTVIEKGAEVGGLARTFVRDGFRFDLGGHRFHSNNPAVVGWLEELLGDDLLTVPRASRIKLNGRFVNYPLTFPDAFTAFPPGQAAGMGASYFLARFTPQLRPERSFEDWVVRRFGRQMYRRFFQPYTEKVWGIPGSQLSAEWAAQRIGLPSMWQTFRHALRPGDMPPATAVTQFYYPRYGFGMIPQALARQILAMDGRILTQTAPRRITPSPGGFHVLLDNDNALHADELIATIPLPALLETLPKGNGRAPTFPLNYRGLICLFLALDKPQVTPDSWTYFPDPHLIFGRTHEPKNWSPHMVPGDDCTSLCVEIFASPHEPVWQWPDERIAAKAVAQLSDLGWIRPREARGQWLLRLPHAYPIYDLGYQTRLEEVRNYLSQWPRLHLLGRTGSFRYLNSDGVIEDVFRFLAERFPDTAVSIPPLLPDGRWV